ncbi:MAG: hypothetical protein ACXWLM_12500 [Myxococcales bacterium]
MRTALALAAAALLATSARADTYSGQVLGADSLSALALLVGASSNSAPLAVAGLAGYAVGAPIIHFVQGRPGAGVGSLLLRLGAPVVGLYIGAASASGCRGDVCQLGPAVTGFGIGMLAASLLDAALIARCGDPDPEPRYSLAASGRSLALRGRF